jgi:hypothetical protein
MPDLHCAECVLCCAVLCHAVCCVAGAYCRLFGRHLDTGETLPYNDSHWRNVVAVLGLSKDQVGFVHRSVDSVRFPRMLLLLPA